MEKLSELSKPAWIVGQQEIDDFMRGDEALLVRGHDPESAEPALRMYSQEYVSALLADNEGMEQTLNVANDAIRLWKERALAAEAKLATPVRLPTEHELHQVACSECAGNCLELVESTVRAAGFTVGDE